MTTSRLALAHISLVAAVATSNPPHLALVLRGESFREGGQGSRHVGETNASLATQRRACASHVKYVIEPFEAAGWRVHVHGASYVSQHGELLQTMYPPQSAIG